MSRLSIQPTGRESAFLDDEIIVSKTDLTGKITYVNDVFARVSAYASAELIGMPHSTIRHPAMPRGVYLLLWEQIQAGREIFVYVVNLCKNGDHYWAFGHVTPTFDATGAVSGYHSTRRTAPRAAVRAVESLYAEMQRAEAGHEKKRDAAAAGLARLQTTLTTLGVSYDEYVWSL